MKIFKITAIHFYFRYSKQKCGKFIILPVEWNIKIVKGCVKNVGSKVGISFLEAGKINLYGQLLSKNTFSAEITLTREFGGARSGGTIAFILKSPLFCPNKNHEILLIADQHLHTF